MIFEQTGKSTEVGEGDRASRGELLAIAFDPLQLMESCGCKVAFSAMRTDNHRYLLNFEQGCRQDRKIIDFRAVVAGFILSSWAWIVTTALDFPLTMKNIGQSGARLQQTRPAPGRCRRRVRREAV